MQRRALISTRSSLLAVLKSLHRFFSADGESKPANLGDFSVKSNVNKSFSMLSTQVKSFVFNGYAPVKSKRQGMSHLCRDFSSIPTQRYSAPFRRHVLSPLKERRIDPAYTSCITLWTESFFHVSGIKRFNAFIRVISDMNEEDHSPFRRLRYNLFNG